MTPQQELDLLREDEEEELNDFDRGNWKDLAWI